MSQSKPTTLMPDRRTFIKGAVGGAVGAVLAASAFDVFAQGTALSVHDLGAGLALIQGAGGNVVMLRGADGVLLVDSGAPAHADELLRLVNDQAGQPVQVLFNTHWHYDHTGGNERIGAAGAKIVAHENTKLWLGGDFYVEWEDRQYKPRPAQALPNETFFDGGGELVFGNEKFVYRHAPRAHTDGDIFIHLPERNVLIAGDLLAVGRYPILDFSTGGWIGGLLDANKAMLEVCDAQTRIIPGTGPVQTRADLQAQHDMLATLRERLAGLMKKGMAAIDMLEAGATQEFDAKWGDPTLFVTNAYRGMWGQRWALGGIV